MMPVGLKAQKMQRCWKFPVWTFKGKSALQSCAQSASWLASLVPYP